SVDHQFVSGVGRQSHRRHFQPLIQGLPLLVKDFYSSGGFACGSGGFQSRQTLDGLAVLLTARPNGLRLTDHEQYSNQNKESNSGFHQSPPSFEDGAGL